MKKMILLLLVSLKVFAQEWCAEETCSENEAHFYAKVLSGAHFLRNTALEGNRSTYQTGYSVAGFLGYCWPCGLRLEGEYAFRRNEIRKIHFFEEGVSSHGHFQTSSCMANVVWDLPLSSWECAFWDIQPFIGAGIGYDFQKMHASNSRIVFNQKWSHFSWQVISGLSYPIFCNTEVSLEYKFHQGGSHFYNHFIGVGFLYKFGR